MNRVCLLVTEYDSDDIHIGYVKRVDESCVSSIVMVVTEISDSLGTCRTLCCLRFMYFMVNVVACS